jgi:hypothetical protein
VPASAKAVVTFDLAQLRQRLGKRSTVILGRSCGPAFEDCLSGDGLVSPLKAAA